MAVYVAVAGFDLACPPCQSPPLADTVKRTLRFQLVGIAYCMKKAEAVLTNTHTHTHTHTHTPSLQLGKTLAKQQSQPSQTKNNV